MSRKNDIDPSELTQDQYAEALSAWLDKPVIKYVAEVTGLPKTVVKYLKDNGIPDLGMVPFPKASDVRTKYSREKQEFQEDIEIPDDMDSAAAVLIANEEAQRRLENVKSMLVKMSMATSNLSEEAATKDAEQKVDGTLATLTEAEKQLAIERSKIDSIEKRAVAADTIRKSAQEAAVARQQMNLCINLGAVFSYFVDNMMLAIESGKVAMPQVMDMKLLSSLTGAMDRLTAATERAIKIEKGRAGEPEKNLGMQVGVLINNCTTEEWDEIARTGTLPQRLRIIEGSAEEV